MLMLVNHQPSGETYVIRQSPAGHCQEITGPWYTPDYRDDSGAWNLGKIADDHRNTDDREDDVEWADGEQWSVIAELAEE